MSRKSRSNPSEEAPQSELFVETARELGADETGEAFRRAFRRAVPQRRPGDPPVKPGKDEDGEKRKKGEDDR